MATIERTRVPTEVQTHEIVIPLVVAIYGEYWDARETAFRLDRIYRRHYLVIQVVEAEWCEFSERPAEVA